MDKRLYLPALRGWLMTLYDKINIALLMATAVPVFLCRYRLHSHSAVGAVLFSSLIYEVFETVTGSRGSSLSDIIFDGIFFLIVLSCQGNVMNFVSPEGIKHYFSRLTGLFR